jgi:hypothetical protein
MRQPTHVSEAAPGDRRLAAMQHLRAGRNRLSRPFAALYNLKMPIYSWAE